MCIDYTRTDPLIKCCVYVISWVGFSSSFMWKIYRPISVSGLPVERKKEVLSEWAKMFVRGIPGGVALSSIHT